jgi:organic radical activating enzyme
MTASRPARERRGLPVLSARPAPWLPRADHGADPRAAVFGACSAREPGGAGQGAAQQGAAPHGHAQHGHAQHGHAQHGPGESDATAPAAARRGSDRPDALVPGPPVNPAAQALRGEGGPGEGSAPVLEVFASLQGEGLYVGEAQIFLRLAGCALRCRYCDTPHSWALPSGSGAPRGLGWLTPLEAAVAVARAEARPGEDHGPQRSVSLTGGEPLEWVPFLRGLRPLLGSRRLHLETSGLFPEALERALPAVDHVSLDLKLWSDMLPPKPLIGGDRPARPSAEPPPQSAQDLARARRASLRLCRGRDASAKLVLTDRSSAAEARAALADLAELAPGLPLFLQPATPALEARAPSEALLASLLDEALDLGLRPRQLPQIHKLLGLP